jgi:acetyl esterase/lipase
MLKFLKFSLILLFLTVGIFSCTNDDSVMIETALNADNYRQELNVSYGIDSNQVYDIYLPENRSLNTKVLILVHGGGWTSGDKNDMNNIKDIIRQDLSDYAIVNINYRLADENTQAYPTQIDDITSVINHLKANRTDYIISDRFGFIGISAGAHLSMLWSYAFDTGNNVDMVCSIVGPTNFTDSAYLNNLSPEVQVLLNTFGSDLTTSFLEEVSPLHQVSATAPPSLLFYGGMDPLIPTTQGTALDERLTALGVTHQFTLYENEGHGWIGNNLIDTWNKIKLFTITHF